MQSLDVDTFERKRLIFGFLKRRECPQYHPFRPEYRIPDVVNTSRSHGVKAMQVGSELMLATQAEVCRLSRVRASGGTQLHIDPNFPRFT